MGRSQKKARIEDALHQTRAVLAESGILPGGGIALLRATAAIDKAGLEGDEAVGAGIVRRAPEAPIRQIAANAGVDGSIVIQNVLSQKDQNHGYNAAADTYVDMVKAGVIDPARAPRTASASSSRRLRCRSSDYGAWDRSLDVACATRCTPGTRRGVPSGRERQRARRPPEVPETATTAGGRSPLDLTTALLLQALLSMTTVDAQSLAQRNLGGSCGGSVGYPAVRSDSTTLVFRVERAVCNVGSFAPRTC